MTPSSSEGLISRWIASEPDIDRRASLRTALTPVNQIERVNPDVAVMDIEMPELDGIFRAALVAGQKAQTSSSSWLRTLTRRNAGDQLQGAGAWRLGLYSEARKYPRTGRR